MTVQYKLYVIDTQMKGATDIVDVLMDTGLFRKNSYTPRDRYTTFYKTMRDGTMSVTSTDDCSYMLTNPVYDTRILQ